MPKNLIFMKNTPLLAKKSKIQFFSFWESPKKVLIKPPFLAKYAKKYHFSDKTLLDSVRPPPLLDFLRKKQFFYASPIPDADADEESSNFKDSKK